MFKPMFAASYEGIGSLPWPLGATTKVDGLRALKKDGEMVSRSLKPIRNTAIAELLSAYLPDGADGEIIVGDTFQSSTSMVMSKSKKLDAKLTYYWFDWIKDGEDYATRTKCIEEYVKEHGLPTTFELVCLIPQILKNESELGSFEKETLKNGFEGVILRKMDSPYKFGRSTLKEAYMLKIKRFSDAEATVIGYEELMHNDNEKKKNELGLSQRSSHKENKRASNKLGALLVKRNGIEFKIGTGFDDAQRCELWEEKENLAGRIVKFKYFEIGIKEAPRHPVFLGFRDADDM